MMVMPHNTAMYIFRCPHCDLENPKAQYLSTVRCSRCRGICKLERYTPELVAKHKLLGSCSSLSLSLDEATEVLPSLSFEEAQLMRDTQRKLSKFLAKK